MKPKQLIIDKNVFVATKTDVLCDFAKNNFLILPEILLYECLTTQKNKEVLLDRFEQVLLVGAHICPNIKSILNEEANNLSPYGSFVNPKTTDKIRSAYKEQNGIFYKLSEMSEYLDENIRNFLNPVEILYEEIQVNDPELSASIRQLDASSNNRLNRFRFWVQLVEQQDIHRLATENLAGITNRPEKYCLSDRWVSWNFFRVTYAVILEYRFLRNHSPTGIKENRAKHDLKDAEYVCLLSCADGVLTRDKKLVTPLAKAAFPEKDVFSDLDEVPDEYICHWS